MSPEHVAHPYPTEQEKAQIMADTGIELKQLTNWFVNNRKRYWKPRVEARLQQQAQAQAVAAAAHIAVSLSQVPAAPQVSAGSSVTHHPDPTTQPMVSLDMTRRNASPLVHPVTPTSSRSVSRTTNSTVTSTGLPNVTAPALATASNIVAAQTTNLPATESTHRVLRAVSIVSSSASASSDSGSYADDVDDEIDSRGKDFEETLDEETGIVTRSETIAVHVLKHSTNEKEAPTIEDVTILQNVPSTRIVRSFTNVMLSYHFPQSLSADRKKVQSRRDAEIVRVKKHYLRVFLNEDRETESRASSGAKRKLLDNEDALERRRIKYSRRNTPAMWRDACYQAASEYDDGLPSLEEAAFLFGFSQ